MKTKEVKWHVQGDPAICWLNLCKIETNCSLLIPFEAICRYSHQKSNSWSLWTMCRDSLPGTFVWVSGPRRRLTLCDSCCSEWPWLVMVVGLLASQTVLPRCPAHAEDQCLPSHRVSANEWRQRHHEYWWIETPAQSAHEARTSAKEGKEEFPVSWMHLNPYVDKYVIDSGHGVPLCCHGDSWTGVGGDCSLTASQTLGLWSNSPFKIESY